MKKEKEVVAALIRKKKKYLLCQRNQNDFYGNLWEFPGGSIEEEEAPSQAIKREISEELGIEVRPAEVLTEFCDENDYLKIKVYFIGCILEGGALEKKDCQDFGFFNLEEIAELNLAPVDKKMFNYLQKEVKNAGKVTPGT